MSATSGVSSKMETLSIENLHIDEKTETKIKSSKFYKGQSLSDLTDAKLTLLIEERLPETCFNIIDVAKECHYFSETDDKKLCRRISFSRTFSWTSKNADFSKIKVYPALIKEQLFGEDTELGKNHLQNASYLYKKMNVWITDDRKFVDLTFQSF